MSFSGLSFRLRVFSVYVPDGLDVRYLGPWAYGGYLPAFSFNISCFMYSTFRFAERQLAAAHKSDLRFSSRL